MSSTTKYTSVPAVNNGITDKSLAKKLAAAIANGLGPKYHFEAVDVDTMTAVCAEVLEAHAGVAAAADVYAANASAMADQLRVTAADALAAAATMTESIHKDSYSTEASISRTTSEASTSPVHHDDHFKQPASALTILSSVYYPKNDPTFKAHLPHIDRSWYAHPAKAKKFKAMRKTSSGRWTPMSTRTPSPYRVAKSLSPTRIPARLRQHSSPFPLHYGLRADGYHPQPGETILESIEAGGPLASRSPVDEEEIKIKAESEEREMRQASFKSDNSGSTLVDDNFNIDPALKATIGTHPRTILQPVCPRRSTRLAEAAAKKAAQRSSMHVPASPLGKRTHPGEPSDNEIDYNGRPATTPSASEGVHIAGREGSDENGRSPRKRVKLSSV